MGLGTLNNRSAGQTILDTFFNDIHSALNGDFVGRNTSGVPTSGQSLGTTAIPWGTLRAAGLVLNGESVDTTQITSPANRIISGKTRSGSNQPAFITPTGSAASFTIFASTTSLILDINGSTVTVATDIAVTGLTTAPSSNNTCLVDIASAAGGARTKIYGEYEAPDLVVDTMGAEIVSLIGKFASFKVGSTEYFHAFVESSTKLSRVTRGYFYDSSLAPKNRLAISNNDTITLLKTGWVFIEDNGTTVSVTYNPPVWAFSSPSSPVTGDYWYDLSNQTWKRYDGASFQIVDRTLVGMVVMDTTNCVAARCEPFFAEPDTEEEIDLIVQSTEIVIAKNKGAKVSVMGRSIHFGESLPTWNITTDLATSADMYNATEQASTPYYLYITDQGQTKISDIEPNMCHRFGGWYHPHNPWRAVGLFYNNASSNITVAEAYSTPSKGVRLISYNGYGSNANNKIHRFATEIQNDSACGLYLDSVAVGATIEILHPGLYEVQGQDSMASGSGEMMLTKNSTELTTTPSSMTQNDTILGFVTPSTLVFGTTISVWCKRGDIIRHHGDSSASNSGSSGGRVRLSVKRMSSRKFI